MCNPGTCTCLYCVCLTGIPLLPISQKRDLVEEARSARVYKDEAEALKLQVGRPSRHVTSHSRHVTLGASVAALVGGYCSGWQLSGGTVSASTVAYGMLDISYYV